jgi:hypothetical protein
VRALNHLSIGRRRDHSGKVQITSDEEDRKKEKKSQAFEFTREGDVLNSLAFFFGIPQMGTASTATSYASQVKDVSSRLSA